MLGKQVIEGFEVSCFLIVHVFHERAKMRVGCDNAWILVSIYESSGELASLIDTQLRPSQYVTDGAGSSGHTYSAAEEISLSLC